WEEIDEGVKGGNYGWPNAEGPSDNAGFQPPIFAYLHGPTATEGFAITGGAFYNPATQQFPSEYAGDYFFADFVSGWIRKLDPERGNFVTGFASNLPSPVDLKVDSAGDLLYLARRGGGLVVKVQFVGTAASANQRFVNQPYLDLLQRPADPTGLAGWTNALTNGASRGQIIQAIQASLEYRQDVIDD